MARTKKVVIGTGPITDGKVRVTDTGPNSIVAGGCSQCHEQMRETAVKFEEGLKRDGKTANDMAPGEFQDRLAEARYRTGR